MGENGYSRPESCQPGQHYYLRVAAASGSAQYQRVEFLGYRPHPGELVVRDGTKSRVIYRIDLFQRGQEGGGSSADSAQ